MEIPSLLKIAVCNRENTLIPWESRNDCLSIIGHEEIVCANVKPFWSSLFRSLLKDLTQFKMKVLFSIKLDSNAQNFS